MKDSVIVIGDAHGCYQTVKALIDKLPHRNICFVGDFIDRGPASADLVQYIRDNEFDSVLGNHEQMMVNSNNGTDEFGWLSNGGFQTVASYGEPSKQVANDLEWFTSLPVHKVYDNIRIEGRKLIVTHSSISRLGKCFAGIDKDKQIFKDIALWDRPEELVSIDGYFNVYGHTPKKEPLITDFSANIDTGCVFKSTRKLTALQLPEMTVFQQENIG